MATSSLAAENRRELYGNHSNGLSNPNAVGVNNGLTAKAWGHTIGPETKTCIDEGPCCF